jgi:hypothetical protein
MNAIPDPVEFKPEPQGATPAERATFEAIYRVEKLQRAVRRQNIWDIFRRDRKEDLAHC